MAARKFVFICLVFAVVLAAASGSNARDVNVDDDADADARIFPAIITFGDSTVDIGNNNNRMTAFKANYPPYGRDFVNHKATGRFCNGKIPTDLTAEGLGFKSYPPAYLSPEATGKNLLIGANFASAAAGYDEEASLLNHAITLSQQLVYYKEYQTKLGRVAGRNKATSIIKDALYLLSCGSGDYVQNYYINPAVRKRYTPDHYSSFLVASFSRFIKDLYGLGARRIGVTSLPPLGCFPAAHTLFGFQEKGCDNKINTDVQAFNNKLNSTAATLRNQLPGLKIVVFDIFEPLYDVIISPSKHGFEEARRSCCGTGTVGGSSVLCNSKAIGTCRNATKYVFWDNVHPSEAANRILADALVVQGFALL